MTARATREILLSRPPRIGVWRDLRRDWQGWSRAEHVAAPLILSGMVAATLPVLWLIAQ